MRKTFILIWLASLAGCKQESLLQSNLLVTGHGGAGFDTYRNTVPPNTLAAMKRGYFTEGADAVEMDIQLTRDSVLILFHDLTLDAMTECGGCVSEHSYADISQCRIDSRNGPLNGKYFIPKLEEVFDLLEGTDATMFLNVKSHDPCVQDELPDYYRRFANELSRILGERNLYNRTFVETYDLPFLFTCRSIDSSFRFIYDLDDFDKAMDVALQNNFNGFAIVNEAVTEVQIASAHAQNLMVIVWGVRVLSASKKAVTKKPDAIMTDDIRMLRQIVDE